MSDPRIFFAAERTLLAWVRTALTVMGLGFVVARFGLFLKVIHQQQSLYSDPIPVSSKANLLGIALVVIGTVIVFAATVQHRNFLKSLPSENLPAFYHSTLALFLAIALGVVGIFITLYLTTEYTS